MAKASNATRTGAPAQNRASEVRMDVAVVLGRTRLPLEALLNWTEGSLIELNKVSGQAADVEVNGEPFARCEVVTVGENFAARLVEILNREAE